MKAKLSIIITAACFIAGCSSEKTIDIDKGTPDENGMVYMEFSSGSPIVENNSRTQLGDNFSVLWSDGDNWKRHLHYTLIMLQLRIPLEDRNKNLSIRIYPLSKQYLPVDMILKHVCQLRN